MIPMGEDNDNNMWNDEEIGERLKVVYRDGDQIRAPTGKLVAVSKELIKLELDDTTLRIGKDEIIKTEEL